MKVSKIRYQRLLGAVTAVVISAVMIACGGDPAPGPTTSGSTGPTGPTGGTGTTTSPLATLEMSAASATIQAKADSTTTITVTAVDANRRALADVPVTLSASSGILTVASDTTDATGRVTATLGVGSDRGNRDVTIKATSGTVSSQTTVSIIGTTVTMTASPPTALSATSPVDITASVVDAAKVPLAGVVVSFVTSAGTLSSAVATTDSSGTAKVTLTGVNTGVTVTSTAANAKSSVDVKAGSTTLPSPSPTGVVIKDLTIQANPSVIGPNLTGGQTNYSQIDVRVTGDLGASLGIPVSNAPVRLRIASSPPFGTLSVDTSAAPVLSNASGLVSIRFIAGAATTGTDQVVVCASVDNVATLPGGGAPCNANEKAVKLTISQEPLFVRISTNNEIAKVNNNLDYEKLFSVYVTNAAGQGVAGAPVSVRLLPQTYWKGVSVWNGDSWVWTPTTSCDNEDKNFNGVLDSGDVDLNKDGILWPGQSSAFTLDNNGVTDSSGFVVIRLRYGQRFALWAEYQIEARAATAGSERLTTYDFQLQASSDDVKKEALPGFATSPFGVAASCTDPR